MKQVLSLVAVGVLVAGTASAQSQKELMASSPELDLATNCTYNIGTANSNKVCISNAGTLNRWESPSGFAHQTAFLGEGFVICSGTTALAYDLGLNESGLGAPLLVASSGSSVTVRRSGAGFTIDQKWTRDNTERDVTVQMTITRTGAPIANVRVARYFDIDVDGGPGNDLFDRSSRAVWARDNDVSNPTSGVTMSAVGITLPVTAAISTNCCFSAPPPGDACLPAEPARPHVGDDSAWIIHALGTMGTGNKKIFKVSYRAH